ncbi:hypothetical protein WICMUC_000537 [Wickerhamomyces mucosus]|uniref:Orc1-like AAA ATPase domain-containing protein n=1 Tax=Wickerhamomyces mucosus TaxID=1378264 RepID=A0A9P8TJ01_9ASCO|nr:hypothetical protein WICMUC_000537 [Wickerhamomyces mucosus]
MDIGIQSRDEQIQLMEAFIRPELIQAPPMILLHGPSSTGKSLTLQRFLQTLDVNHSWIHCDECVSIKILWKKIIQSVITDSKLKVGNLGINSNASNSFQSFVNALHELFEEYNYNKLHYLILDRSDQMMEDNDTMLRNFMKFREVSGLDNISVIFIINSIPRRLVTQTPPQIYFQPYSNRELISILSKEVICEFPTELNIPLRTKDSFWESYVKLVVDSYYSYTKNILQIKRILIRLWDKFIEPIKDGQIKPNEFLQLYRKNYNLIASDFGLTTPITFTEVQPNEEDEEIDQEELKEEETNSFTHLSSLSKYLLVAAYLASFNDSKQDWLYFSKLKDVNKRNPFMKQLERSKRRKTISRLMEPKPFDLERLLAITHAIYNIDSAILLQSDVDMTTQIANLSSLKFLVKSNNQEYINSKTKWKVNVNFEDINQIAKDINFPLHNYLID